MNKYFLLLFLFISLSAKAQIADSGKVIGIHPAVGKTIAKDEKIKYHLFPEYKDSLFSNAKVIKYNDSTFTLTIQSITGTDLTKPINTKQLDDLYYAIDDVEKAKNTKEDEYVRTPEEKQDQPAKKVKRDNSAFWYNFLAEMTILTFETLITFAFTN